MRQPRTVFSDCFYGMHRLRCEPNTPIVARELYRTLPVDIPEQTFYKSLERLTKAGKAVHLAKGLYYRPRTGRFGEIPISDKEIVDYYIGEGQGVLVGYRLYNKKGITTQLSKYVEVYSKILSEDRKKIKNVSVKKISVELTDETIPVIETLDILNSYDKIENLDRNALLAYLKAFAEIYSDKAANHVISHMKYKKSTIAFLASVLDRLSVPHTLAQYLSPMSDYKIPRLEWMYETAR